MRKKQNQISKLSMLVIQHVSIYEFEAETSNPQLREELSNAGFKDQDDKIVYSGDLGLNDLKRIMRFLTILNKHEPIDFEQILIDMGEVNETLAKAAEQCDAKAISDIAQDIQPCDINTFKNSRKESLLMLAASARENISEEKVISTVTVLLKLGANPLIPSNDERTALMSATNFYRPELIRTILKCTPIDSRIEYIHKKDNIGSTAKKYAGRYGTYPLLQKQASELLDKCEKETQEEISRIKHRTLPQHSYQKNNKIK